jgi:hypothetical protein
MLPAIIEDIISKIADKKTHIEKRQFYYATLLKIRDEANTAILKYEKEKNRK